MTEVKNNAPLQGAISKLLEGKHPSGAEIEVCLDSILSGRVSESLIASLLVLLRVRGERGSDLAAAARSLRKHAPKVEVDSSVPLVDTCGTGGSKSGSFNISTIAALLVAACGHRVAKHGNRAVSSKTGTADLLEALGVEISLSPEKVALSIEKVGIGFLYAPSFHKATGHVGPVRSTLGVPTLFNLIGPLSNPAGATHQLLGVYDRTYLPAMAEALCELGVESAWVVHGEGGLDEISPSGTTWVCSVQGESVRSFEVSPGDFGIDAGSLDDIRGGSAKENAEIARRLLHGETVGPRTAVLMNAAAALCIVNPTLNLEEALERAREALDSGKALNVLKEWAELTTGQGV